MALSSALIKIFITFLFLQNHVNSQYSSPSKPQPSLGSTISFSITKFDDESPNIFVKGDASISNGVLSLTKTDKYSGKPLQKSVGRATHLTPIHIWDETSGELADFSTSFSFIVNTNGSRLHGDGFTFFLGPLHFDLPKNSSGGYLGLFNPETALIPSQNPIVAIEFDSFTNGWDPASPSQYPHIGIDVGSIDSRATVNWPLDFVQTNALGEASINYNSESKRLSVFVAYPGSGKNATGVSFVVDLRSVLPEWVRVGFSAATGELVETHDIINWSFEAAL
ncbi:putative concanavalin A-like lectin/glucanase domain, legume lectin [Medicago truncatula]|uniref:Lectin 9 n=1 Tax=Medicago truncatula TaxID=3880 RepID=LEC9_MEDTR|nr:lectin 9 precursor [Medicago truncatula]Q2PP74.1 RecName: Full=Lectin 9; Short=MtLec9; AltName: Full=Agglutinin LEC9; Flags: Precursor [Medicago truncatula]ABC47815.1 lectin-like protein [Medicago truncatula]RHN54886.1 putative concanavalin A-like lectin/glucanase domain, legume lectin [Medicago truncatula]